MQQAGWTEGGARGTRRSDARLQSPAFRLSAGRLFRLHLCLIVALGLAHLASAAFLNITGRGETLWRKLALGGEANLPSLFSAVALALCGLLAWFVLARKDDPRNAGGWRLAGVMLGYMGVDEAISLHEQLKWLAPQEPGELSLFWILPYAALVAVAVAILLPFWLRLPARVRSGLAVAALLFVGGALGMELVEGMVFSAEPGAYSRGPLLWTVLVEEMLEMGAVALALFVMLRHLATLPEPRLRIEAGL